MHMKDTLVSHIKNDPCIHIKRSNLKIHNVSGMYIIRTRVKTCVKNKYECVMTHVQIPVPTNHLPQFWNTYSATAFYNMFEYS